QQDKTMRKIPLTINTKGNISVVNLNDPTADAYNPIVLYVVDQSKAEESSYEVYDAYYTTYKYKGATFTPQSNIVTVISAYDFRLHAEPAAEPRSITARLAGFDNALDNNKDGCPFAYKTPYKVSFDGFILQASSPILSLTVDKQDLQLHTDFQFDSQRGLGTDGFFSTPGWNGCT
ncbi:hypothetical protein PENTCL1PPCAC_13525, partial [Pristionchus entomophagus]